MNKIIVDSPHYNEPVGFYLMHRGWMDNPIFSEEKFTEREAWLWLIQEASFEPHKIRYKSKMIEVGRGQIPTSYRKLKDKWKWSQDRICRYIELLKNEGMVGTHIEHGFLVITLCNYEKYQNRMTEIGTQAGTPTGTQAGTNRKKVSEKKGDPPKGVSPKESQPIEDFDFSGCVEVWNQTTGGKVNPKNSTDDRKRRLGNALRRVTEHYGLTPEQSWLALCQYIQESDLLAGRKSAWKAEIDWVLKPENLTKILEGNYENRDQPATSQAHGKTPTQRRLDAIAARYGVASESPENQLEWSQPLGIQGVQGGSEATRRIKALPAADALRAPSEEPSIDWSR